MTPLRNLAAALDDRLSNSLQRFARGADHCALSLPAPTRLAERAMAVGRLFDEGKPAEPPSQARINAIARLRDGKNAITRKEWMLIAWGLCDQCGRVGMPINDTTLFAQVIDYVDGQASSGIGRKLWFGLLHSYFAYPDADPKAHANWRALREKLNLTLPGLLARQARPKSWATALQRNADLLTDHAGIELAHALSNNDDTIAREVSTYLPVPESSWLWRDVIEQRLGMLAGTSDDTFRTSIPALLELSARHAMQADRILAAVLTRYADAQFSKEAHLQLKQTALERWQNPQVKTANRWSLVDDDVRRMVLQWFAKADLEHFFSLLQGEGDVDDARLQYWLRFVDQISYTRIVMGQDAFMNPSADFVDFRKKNKDRFSRLVDHDSANNAFIMCIGGYTFVEFSKTNNACYIYSNENLPFDPQYVNLPSLTLKNKARRIEHLVHNGGWEYSADRKLAKLGLAVGQIGARMQHRSAPRQLTPLPTIDSSREQRHALDPAARPPSKISIDNLPLIQDQETHPAPSPVAPISMPSWPAPTGQLSGPRPAPAPAVAAAKRTVAARTAQGEDRIEQAVRGASVLALRHNIPREDLRSKGGAFWILYGGEDQQILRQLMQLGFTRHLARGFWIR